MTKNNNDINIKPVQKMQEKMDDSDAALDDILKTEAIKVLKETNANMLIQYNGKRMYFTIEWIEHAIAEIAKEKGYEPIILISHLIVICNQAGADDPKPYKGLSFSLCRRDMSETEAFATE